MAAVNAFTTFLAPQLRSGKRFRFIYLSGLLAERDHDHGSNGGKMDASDFGLGCCLGLVQRRRMLLEAARTESG